MLCEGSVDIAEQVGLVLVKSFEGDELAHVRGGQRRWTSGLVVGEKVQHLVKI